MNIKLIKSFLQSPIAVIKKDIREYMELKQNISQAQFDQACARARITLVCFNDEDRPSCITQHKFFVQSVHDIDIELLKNKKIAAVSSGASTPTYLTNQVIEYLNQFDYQDHNTYQKPELDMSKII